MSLLGYPLASRYQDLTPLQLAFLEVALPRAEARRNGVDPDDPEGEKKKGAGGPGKKGSSTKKPKDGKPNLGEAARKKRAAKNKEAGT